MMVKPFSQACVDNREPILAVLKRVFAQQTRVLEIGSGTGQHAVYFAENLPHLHWQTSDLPGNHGGIRAWLDDYSGNNVGAPLTVDVREPIKNITPVDAIFSANTAHIMTWDTVQSFFQQLPLLLVPGGVLVLYGPFNYHGKYTSESNQQFDAYLKQNNPLQGIRDFEAIDALAKQANLSLLEDNPMPANNRLLVWQKAF